MTITTNTATGYRGYRDIYNYRYNNNRKKEGIKRAIVLLAFMLGIFLIIGNQLARAITKHIENQDIMLCESAKISENKEWLQRCECYYKLEDIRCLGVNK